MYETWNGGLFYDRWEDFKMSNCNICPRKCNADREHGERGICGVFGEDIWIARASLHQWEEPCISGEVGSGTVFFCGCSLGCVYCQNYEIAHIFCLDFTNKERKSSWIDKIENFSVSVKRLAEIFLELQEKKASNINFVVCHIVSDSFSGFHFIAGNL